MSSRVGEHGEPGVLQERSDVEYPVAHPKRQKIDFIGNIKYRLGMSIEVPKKEVKEDENIRETTPAPKGVGLSNGVKMCTQRKLP